ncbi:hypothetical protein VY88_15750 [Azospirillum thiophilum]|uniref:Molybdate ABC transporter substrate-binding protein n=1 Tax=Azospirillum thiophilum TaxID=528244 RepID=A0AAC8ZVB0_9PROT|nr:hypothetical protein AL072_17760 [Azospirillum thiophilum]KJR64632.1 hypothetical protein VY88_15750 [Azospirillum thiophilum]
MAGVPFERLVGGGYGEQEPVRVFAAGSLKAAFVEAATDYALSSGVPVECSFGPSGLLRERLERDGPGGLFASANMEHPAILNGGGRSGPVRVFARNQLCALVQPDVEVTPDTLLERMLDPAIRVGTSTPKADPSGDYAWAMFRKAERLQPGSHRILDGKALRLAGGTPAIPIPPKDRNPYGWLMEGRHADLFLTYRTNAQLAICEVPALKLVALPEPLAVEAEYGLTVLNGPASARGEAFADYILSPAGQAALERYGFSNP